ncbi:hypothetical protein ACLOJK_028109 [Asimina triloba]
MIWAMLRMRINSLVPPSTDKYTSREAEQCRSGERRGKGEKRKKKTEAGEKKAAAVSAKLSCFD